MNRTVNILTFCSHILQKIALVFLLFITACTGGSIVFDAGSEARIDVDENTSGVVWISKAQVVGQANAQNLVFELSGTDAALFSVDTTTGAVSFKTPADFELPLDADKNNEYRINIEARNNGKSSLQGLYLQVKNVAQPVVELIKPKLNENVGTGETIEVETLVRFYDAESNSPITDASVMLNSTLMGKAEDDSRLWKGKIIVPEGGVKLAIEAGSAQKNSVQFTTQLFNKRNAIKTTGFGFFDGESVSLMGSNFGIDSRLDLSKNEILGTFGGVSVGVRRHIAFHPRLPILYTLVPPSVEPGEWDFYAMGRVGMSIATGAEYRRIPFPTDASALAVDDKNSRIIVVEKKSLLEGDGYFISAVALSQNGYFSEFAPQLIFKLPADIVKGEFKQFGIDGVSKTYIFADERTVNGAARTIIQGHGEDGIKRFESQVGPDSSNLAVHESAGLIYVVENSSTARANVKTIELATGKVGDLLEPQSENLHGAYVALGLDRNRNRLYLGDDVSDSIFVVDLATKFVKELVYTFIPSQLEEGTDN